MIALSNEKRKVMIGCFNKAAHHYTMRGLLAKVSAAWQVFEHLTRPLTNNRTRIEWLMKILTQNHAFAPWQSHEK
jgi:hypothetical protein